VPNYDGVGEAVNFAPYFDSENEEEFKFEVTLESLN